MVPAPSGHDGPDGFITDSAVVHPSLVLAPSIGHWAIRRMATRDLPASADAHLDQLPIGLFPDLGTGFLRRWHGCFIGSAHAVSYVAVSVGAAGPRVVGFLIGTTDQAAHSAALLADRRATARLAAAGAAALVRRPRVAARFCRSRALPWARAILGLRAARPAGKAGTAGRPAGPTAVLTAVAVDPARRGEGIGAALVNRFVRDARLSGAARAELVSAVGPGGATGFYERLGWQAGPSRRSRDGEEIRTYRRDLRVVDSS